jgi:hypothetical protein
MLMKISVGITGTQKGLTEAQFAALELLLPHMGMTEIHAGDCVGVDAEIVTYVKEALPSVKTVGHPPTIADKRAFLEYDEERAPKDYLVRNHAIVDAADYLVACPKEDEEVLRSGTWATVRYARKTGKTVVIIKPDGTWGA